MSLSPDDLTALREIISTELDRLTEGISTHLAAMEQRIDTKIEARIDHIIGELAEMEGRTNTKFDLVRSEVRDARSELGTDIKLAQRASLQAVNHVREDLQERGVLSA